MTVGFLRRPTLSPCPASLARRSHHHRLPVGCSFHALANGHITPPPRAGMSDVACSSRSTTSVFPRCSCLICADSARWLLPFVPPQSASWSTSLLEGSLVELCHARTPSDWRLLRVGHRQALSIPVCSSLIHPETGLRVHCTSYYTLRITHICTLLYSTYMGGMRGQPTHQSLWVLHKHPRSDTFVKE